MTRFSRLFRYIALVIALVAVRHAGAAEPAGTATVRQANEALRELLRHKVAPGSPEEKKLTDEVTAKLSSFLDVDELGRRAIKDHYAELSAAQRTEYEKLLRELVQANYLRALRSEIDYQTSYLGEKPRGDDTVVSTEVKVTRSSSPQVIDIDYVLRKDTSGLRVFDIITDGVGLVENYRAQFNKIIAKDGVSGLLDKLRKKRSQTQ